MSSEQPSKLNVRVRNALTLSTALLLMSGCKSRFFTFSTDPQVTGATSSNEGTRSGQVAISSQNSSNSNSQTPIAPASSATSPARYVALQGAKTNLVLGSASRFNVNGQQVDVTFEKVLEDSRCPRDVVCVWEGQARLQFKINVPALNLTKTVTPTLRAGHPEMGQVSIGAVALDLLALNPEVSANASSGQKPSTPEATIVVGKAP
ncbi:hypothetical protein EBU99_06340 [bacterium]|nr:hypothetical protein [bacterium]